MVLLLCLTDRVNYIHFLIFGPFVTSCGLYQQHVAQYDGSHCLYNRDGSRDDTWVVTAFGLKSHLFTFEINCLLGESDGCRRLESNLENNGLAIGDSPLNAAAVIGLCPQTISLCNKGIIVA